MKTMGTTLAVVGALVLAACGGGDGNSDNSASTEAESSTTTAAEKTASGGEHPCDLVSLAEMNRLSGLTFTETERHVAKPDASFNSDSCEYKLDEPPAPGKRVGAKATILTTITRPGVDRKLDHTGAGSFLNGGRPPIEGIAGATQTGQYYGEAAARFGEERIVSVRITSNAAVDDTGFDRSPKSVEILKALLALGA